MADYIRTQINHPDREISHDVLMTAEEINLISSFRDQTIKIDGQSYCVQSVELELETEEFSSCSFSASILVN